MGDCLAESQYGRDPKTFLPEIDSRTIIPDEMAQ